MSGQGKTLRLGVGDLLLLFVLLISVVSGFLRFRELKSDMVQSGISEYRVLLLSDAMHTSAADCLRQGELLYSAAGDPIGRVVGLTQRPLEVHVTTAEGTLSGTWPIEQKCRLQVEVLVLGTMRDGVFLLNGRVPLPIGIGQTLFGERLMVSGVVIAASEASSETGDF